MNVIQKELTQFVSDSLEKQSDCTWDKEWGLKVEAELKRLIELDQLSIRLFELYQEGENPHDLLLVLFGIVKLTSVSG